MNKVQREAIKELLETEGNITLSLYMPAHQYPTSDHISEDMIRFKNLLKAGREALDKKGVDDATATEMIGQLKQLQDDTKFWQHVTSGMAFFCSPSGMQYFHLPIECDEYVHAGNSFDVAPLLITASYDQPYYVLALATKEPKLFKGDMYGIENVEIELPKSLEEALNIDEMFSNSRTDRVGNYGAGSKAHGQGDSRQAGQEELLKFFRMIDDSLISSDAVDNKVPVLLAGTEEDVSAYRESSRLSSVMESSLHGNYITAHTQELFDRTWPLVIKECIEPIKSQEIEKLNSLVGTGRASLENGDISRAAEQGRAETLLVGMLMTTRDSVSDVNKAITKIIFSDSYRSDKISSLARSVFDHGGKVIGIVKGEMPQGAAEAAVYRY